VLNVLSILVLIAVLEKNDSSSIEMDLDCLFVIPVWLLCNLYLIFDNLKIARNNEKGGTLIAVK